MSAPSTCVVFALASLIFCYSSTTSAIAHVEESARKVGANTITIFKPSPVQDETVEFCLSPPDKGDNAIDLSIAAAFTTRASSISGIAICKGEKISGPVNVHLNGTFIIIDGNFQIFSNEHGKLLTPDFIDAVTESGGSLFQQFMLVKDKTAQSFHDKSTAPRRALAVFANGDRAVVQELKPITMAEFARDLQFIGVNNALYAPVGDADGGWCRNKSHIISIGKTSSPTPVQSNWVIWKEATQKPDDAKIDKWLHQHLHKFKQAN